MENPEKPTSGVTETSTLVYLLVIVLKSNGIIHLNWFAVVCWPLFIPVLLLIYNLIIVGILPKLRK